MNKEKRAQIRERLQAERERLIASALGTLEDVRHPNQDDLNDEVDLATFEQNETVSLRLRDREAGLLSKIDETLSRLDNNGTDFGFCETCGAEIGFERLLARPVATLCIQCKEEQERVEQGYAS
ncbi:MAG: TraR/DksA C4-type zinc finger protein [Deltaproteobacteria bacterium]|nr:TraR/DksA C4-type zinc finger protein [Deltaproteobacteria bacterium]